MDHDERWSRVRNSALKDLYLGEIQTLLLLIIDAANALIELAPKDVGGVLKVHREIGLQASHLISATGKLQALLFDTPQTKSESSKRWELRKRRAAWLREEVFSGVDVAVLNDRGVRNSIEHFDDRLDEVAEMALDEQFAYPLHVVSDVALGYDGILNFLEEIKSPPMTTRYIRTYIARSQTFHVLRWSFSVADVLHCCEQMAARLIEASWVDPRGMTMHTGSILVVPKRPE